MLALLFALAAATEPPSFTTLLTDTKVAPGAAGRVTFILGMPEDYHVFRDMIEVKVLGAGGLVPGAPVYPPGEVVPDPVDGSRTREQWRDSLAVDLPFSAPSSLAGPQTVRVSARFQACKDTLCTLPYTRELTSTVTVTPKGGGP